ncbi:MAG TPA: AzlD domain-containing protein [Lachnospiraceae bacterium]|nr:AzlD domain-containing protein [Lachnospiraceae bacterium]
MQINMILLILLMALVTYTPRALPAVLINHIKINKRAEKFLQMIPYTAMGTLIFPGILSTNPNSIWVGIMGGCTAIFLRWKKVNITFTIIGSICSVMLLYYLTTYFML